MLPTFPYSIQTPEPNFEPTGWGRPMNAKVLSLSTQSKNAKKNQIEGVARWSLMGGGDIAVDKA